MSDSDPVSPQPDEQPPGAPPPDLRFLKLLVTVLTGVMIAGLVTIVALLVIRIGPAPAPPLPALPDQITLPQGVTPQALTFARDWIVVVGADGTILLFDRQTGALVQQIAPPAAIAD